MRHRRTVGVGMSSEGQMSEHIEAIKKLVSQFPPGNLNRKLWALVIAELEELRRLYEKAAR